MKMKSYSLLTSSIALYCTVFFALRKGIKASDISLVDFQGILFTEINREIEEAIILKEASNNLTQPQSLEYQQGRSLQVQDVMPAAQDLWVKVIQHGWDLALSNGKSIQKRSLKETQDEAIVSFPYIVCSHSPQTGSAFQRLQSMLKHTGAYLGDAVVVLNEPKKTCYHVSLEYDRAQSILKDEPETTLNSANEHYYTIAPMTDLMKIQFDTMAFIQKDSWTIPSTPNLNDWERIIRVSLSAGHRMANIGDENKVSSIAKKVLNEIKSLGQSGSKNRQKRKLQKGLSELSEASLMDLFSITAKSKQKNEVGEDRYLRQEGVTNITTSEKAKEGNRWIRALELGLEAEHTCNNMFNRLDVKVHYDNQGFDIVLNPRILNDHNHGIESEEIQGIDGQNIDKESSASNKYCVVSLIMALSIHPLVLSVESEGPVESSDYESQWITESKSQYHRPLRDLGINGKGQVISIIDSGLDIDHEYFGPTNAKVFHVSLQQVKFELFHLFTFDPYFPFIFGQEWDYSQRKVVRYDHSRLGDTSEPKGGHGTKVAAVAAGVSFKNSYDEANGVAEGAKLHIYDIQKSNGKIPSNFKVGKVKCAKSDQVIFSGFYSFPSVYDLFESMHSAHAGNPARVANGSFMTPYRAYPSSCKHFDDALYGKFQGDLFIASAGNGGLDKVSMKSIYRTIGNPASCKNTLAGKT